MTTAIAAAMAVFLVLARLAPAPLARTVDAATPADASRSRLGKPRDPRRRHQPSATLAVAAWLDAVSRGVRSGSTLSASIRGAAPPAHRLVGPQIDAILHALDRGATLDAALTIERPATDRARGERDGALSLGLAVLRACAASGGPAAPALDRAAATLRARDADLADRRTHSAQARASARVMTVLPLATLLLLAVTTASTRRALASPAGITAVAVGSGLNVAGWRWMSAIIEARRPRRSPGRAFDALPDAIELLVVAIRSGLSPSVAMTAVAADTPPPIRPAFDEVVHRMHRGERLADALVAITEVAGPAAAPFVDSLATADRYGLPLEPVLDRLATDVRTERRHANERHARTLPVRLAFPLVVCSLPSFALLAIAPALLGAIASLQTGV